LEHLVAEATDNIANYQISNPPSPASFPTHIELTPKNAKELTHRQITKIETIIIKKP
jgi:hypothetical protein